MWGGRFVLAKLTWQDSCKMQAEEPDNHRGWGGGGGEEFDQI